MPYLADEFIEFRDEDLPYQENPHFAVGYAERMAQVRLRQKVAHANGVNEPMTAARSSKPELVNGVE